MVGWVDCWLAPFEEVQRENGTSTRLVNGEIPWSNQFLHQHWVKNQHKSPDYRFGTYRSSFTRLSLSMALTNDVDSRSECPWFTFGRKKKFLFLLESISCWFLVDVDLWRSIDWLIRTGWVDQLSQMLSMKKTTMPSFVHFVKYWRCEK